MGSCIDAKYVKRNGINTTPAARPIPVYNADGTLNEGGSIRKYVQVKVKIGDHGEKLVMGVMKLNLADIFLGHKWLKHHNSSVDWTHGHIVFDRCPKACACLKMSKELERDSPEEWTIRAVTELFEAEKLEKHVRQLSEGEEAEWKAACNQIPQHLHMFRDVFSERMFTQLPERRRWDHAIDLQPGAVVKDSPIIPLSLERRKVLDEFIDENL